MAPTELLERAKESADLIGESVSEILGTPAIVQFTEISEVSALQSQLASCYAIAGEGATLFLSSEILDALPDDDSGTGDKVELLSSFARRAWPVVSSGVAGKQVGGSDEINVRGPGVADLGAILGTSVIAAIVNIRDVPIDAFVLLGTETGIEGGGSTSTPQRGEAQALQLDELEASAGLNMNALGLGILGDVEVNVTVELGRRRIPLNELLKLTRGSIIELEKLVGEPLEVYVNNRLIADGEAVVIDDHFGIRITNVIPSIQRNG